MPLLDVGTREPGRSVSPAVSICMPVWNGQSYVGEAIDSALAQTYSDFELVIQDDHSTDETPAILARYRDPRVRVERNARHLGQGRTANRAIARASGRYVHFLSHDDRMLPGCVETSAGFLDRHAEVGLCFGRFERIDAGGRRLWVNPTIAEQADKPLIAPPEVSARLFFKHGCLPGSLSTVMVSRQAIDACGGFDERFQRRLDWDLWVRISRRFCIAILPDVLLQIRDHPGQHSKYADPRAGVRESYAIRARLDALLPADYLAPRDVYLRANYSLSVFRFAMRALMTRRLRAGLRVLAEVAKHENLAVMFGLYLRHVRRRGIELARQRYRNS